MLMYKAMSPHKRKTAKNEDSRVNNNFCGIKAPVINPAMATDHHGNTRPIEKASNAVTTIETINFI